MFPLHMVSHLLVVQGRQGVQVQQDLQVVQDRQGAQVQQDRQGAQVQQGRQVRQEVQEHLAETVVHFNILKQLHLQDGPLHII